VEFNEGLRFYDIILEGNAMQIVNAVKAKDKNWTKYEHSVDEIRESLLQLRSWRTDHMKKDADSAGHGLKFRETTKVW
jgi:hypothetical protein